ncbi:integrase [Undibacterium sp. GrIS 1.8]|uniref:tyrosine-type recombinase/integrase n=1 Tax=unclassified Undibacterium TaxID=2630295 RepID=UPI0033950F52
MPLTDIQVRTAKPTEKPFRLADERGIYLEVAVNGSKYWRLKYRLHGKEKLMALGVYPEVSLKEARDKRDAARKLVAEGIDPLAHKKAKKSAAIIDATSMFETVAREWFSKYSPNWVANHASKIINRLDADIFPWLGKKDIKYITAPELLETLRRVEGRGAIETAHRILQNCGQIFRYAIATGRAERDISADLKGAIPPTKQKHHPTITEPKAVASLLHVINGYEGTFVTKCALQLAPLLFVRPGELRHAEWTEFNFETSEWRIPAEKMKMRTLHIVPLSTQALKILNDIKPLTGDEKYLFPGARSKDRPMSENTINGALRRLGYSSEEMTGHGFRSMASTLLNEQGWNRDAIERQLAHGERDQVRAAYNYAEHLPERRKMMQAWADYLDALTINGIVLGDFDKAA